MRDDPIFKRFTLGRYPINAFLMADRETGVGVFIDPGGFSDEVEAFIGDNDIDLKYVFLCVIYNLHPITRKRNCLLH